MQRTKKFEAIFPSVCGGACKFSVLTTESFANGNQLVSETNRCLIPPPDRDNLKNYTDTDFAHLIVFSK